MLLYSMRILNDYLGHWCFNLYIGEIMENTRNYVINKVLGNPHLLSLVANNDNGKFLDGMIKELRMNVETDGYISVVTGAKLEVRDGKKMILVIEYTSIDEEVIPELLLGEMS